MQKSRITGRLVMACTHHGSGKCTSIDTASAIAGTQVKQMTKKAGPSAGSAKL
jgi:hypothetical protein